MENDSRFQSDGLKKKHFAKLHERIQTKYEEMQRKLEKSKSLDTLTTQNNEDFIFKEKHYVSNAEINKTQDLEFKHIQSVVTQDIKEFDATFEDSFDFVELDLSRSESDLTPSEYSQNGHYERGSNKFFSDEFSSGSVESLNKVPFEKDDVFLSTPASPAKTFRQRLFGKKEKRQKEKQDKLVNKEKIKDAREKVEKLVLSNSLKQDIFKVLKKTKVGTITIALIEATSLEDENTEERQRILSCRFRLGTEKYKSKVIKSNTLNVQWQELLNLNLFEETILEITLCDKDVILGRSMVNLSELEKEKTHKMQLNLESKIKKTNLLILLTISGTTFTNTITDMEDYESLQNRISSINRKFAWHNFRDENSDVGYLSIIIYGAKGLAGHDCYCVVELANERLQTHTEFKTNEPSWMKIFTYTVTDVTEILDFTVYDERKSEEIGKVSIPLLRIRNGKKKWYALKESRQRERAKGSNPRIILEMNLMWNLVKASFRVINPKETKYLDVEAKFDRQLFSNNLTRAKIVTNWILDALKVVKTCFEWESKRWNVTALIIWLLLCWFFKVWMLPLLFLVPFMWYKPDNYSVVKWKQCLFKKHIEEEDDTKNEKEEKQSLRQKINSLQEMVQTVQNAIGTYASLGERIKNLYNFTVPYLSFLGIFLITLIAFVMFIIPAKYIFMLWGVHKFTRKILRPNRVANNEILDLLSRVPDDNILMDCEELRLENLSDEEII